MQDINETAQALAHAQANVVEAMAGLLAADAIRELAISDCEDATIELAGGPTLEVGPGDVGVLEAGAETTWTIHEDLRKIYIIRP